MMPRTNPNRIRVRWWVLGRSRGAGLPAIALLTILPLPSHTDIGMWDLFMIYPPRDASVGDGRGASAFCTSDAGRVLDSRKKSSRSSPAAFAEMQQPQHSLLLAALISVEETVGPRVFPEHKPHGLQGCTRGRDDNEQRGSGLRHVPVHRSLVSQSQPLLQAGSVFETAAMQRLGQTDQVLWPDADNSAARAIDIGDEKEGNRHDHRQDQQQ